MFEITTFPEEARYTRPESIDFGSLERIRQIRPVEKACGPITDHNLDLIDTVRSVRAWYQGKRQKTPGELLSRLLNPNLNAACQMLGALVQVILDFQPGAFPAHCSAVRQLQFSTVMLLRELNDTIDSPAVKAAFNAVDDFFAVLSASGNFLVDTDSYDRRIKAKLEEMLRSFGEISNSFHQRERQRDAEIAFSKMSPVTVEDVKNAANAAAEKVNEHTTAAAKEAANEVTAEMRITAADVKDHTTAESAAAVAEVKKTVRKAKRAIIKNHNTARESEADLRTPKGERARQIAAVKSYLRDIRAKGQKASIRQTCFKIWTNVKGGYPTPRALYSYCERHQAEF